MRTYVLSTTHQRARHWCQANGLSPHDRSVVIITNPEAIRGRRLLPDDAVIKLDMTPAMHEEWRVIELLSEVS